MKIALLLAVYAVAAVGVYGQSAADSVKTSFTNQSVTASYVAGTSIPLKSYDSFVVVTKVGTAVAGITASFKNQWSDDDVVWVDEKILVAGTAAGGEQPYTSLSRVITLDLASTSTNYVERVRRLAKFYRPAIKGSAATNATLSVEVLQMNNQN